METMLYGNYPFLQINYKLSVTWKLTRHSEEYSYYNRLQTWGQDIKKYIIKWYGTIKFASLLGSHNLMCLQSLTANVDNEYFFKSHSSTNCSPLGTNHISTGKLLGAILFLFVCHRCWDKNTIFYHFLPEYINLRTREGSTGIIVCTAASVLLKLFINGNKGCHITDTPIAHEQNELVFTYNWKLSIKSIWNTSITFVYTILILYNILYNLSILYKISTFYLSKVKCI